MSTTCGWCGKECDDLSSWYYRVSIIDPKTGDEVALEYFCSQKHLRATMPDLLQKAESTSAIS